MRRSAAPLASFPTWRYPLLEIVLLVVATVAHFLPLDLSPWVGLGLLGAVASPFFSPLLQRFSIRAIWVDALLAVASIVVIYKYSIPLRGEPILSVTAVLGLVAPYGGVVAAVSAALRRLGALLWSREIVTERSAWRWVLLVFAILCVLWFAIAFPIIGFVFQEEGPNAIQPIGMVVLLCPALAFAWRPRARLTKTSSDNDKPAR